MHNDKLILDLGSQAAKVFRKLNDRIEQVDVLTWELSESGVSLPSIEGKLKSLLSTQGSFLEGLEQGTVEAISLEEMRKSPHLFGHMEEVCRNLKIAYRTIGQKEAAEMLKKAIAESDIPNHLDVINADGDSIQIITNVCEAPYQIPFGISDLNQQFNLLGPPNQRQIATCIKWISSRLPATLEKFAYTGKNVSASFPSRA
ncbi:hypothetical protein SAMN04487897_102873 [Paenibacillus sp. yr247]|uniref:hypothetical protein n=1 Tax=Paenibacillus sp. yr247 TaxID=1761880 RepID=UPI00088A41C7|nr:hypothetical protein [Paenibacillus sp. yr247]SDN42531.1 hypothetical protein SAMN04487897_102873 [Paenibacillus sp. yr247]